jgi:hypothetical protein
MIADTHLYTPIRYGSKLLHVKWVGLTTLRLEDNDGGCYAFSKQLYWEIFYKL